MPVISPSSLNLIETLNLIGLKENHNLSLVVSGFPAQVWGMKQSGNVIIQTNA